MKIGLRWGIIVFLAMLSSTYASSASSIVTKLCAKTPPYESQWVVILHRGTDTYDVLTANQRTQTWRKNDYEECGIQECTPMQINTIKRENLSEQINEIERACCSFDKNICNEARNFKEKINDCVEPRQQPRKFCLLQLSRYSPQKNCIGKALIVPFNNNSSILTSAAKDALDEFIVEYGEDAKIELLVVGHTNHTGPEELNRKLSRARARTVTDYLEPNLQDRVPINTQGKGWALPIEEYEETHRLQRRVEISIKRATCNK